MEKTALENPYVAEQPEDYAYALDLMSELEQRYNDSRMFFSRWRMEAVLCYDYKAGHQWDENDLQKLRDELRPALTFNRTDVVVDTISGLEIGNRQQVRYLPRVPGRAQPSEILSGAADWIREECDAEDEESEAFVDAITCGMGWTNTSLNYIDDEQGKIDIERVDPLEMYPDPASSKKNYSDAEFLIRVRDLPRQYLKDNWPDKESEIALGSTWLALEADDSLVLRGDIPSSTDGYKQPDRSEAHHLDLVRVVEYQRRVSIQYVQARNPITGEVEEMSPEKFVPIAEALQMRGMPVQFTRRVKRVVMRAIMCGNILLEDKIAPDPDSYSYKCITGKRDRNNGYYYGVVRHMIDPQQWANKWLSQLLHMINANAKGGVMMEEGAVDDIRKFEKSWADPSSITWVPPGTLANNRLQPKTPPAFPQGAAMETLLNFAIQSIRDVVGVNVELQGLANKDQPASLEYQRKQAGITILNPFFDALRRYRKNQGRTLLSLIQNYMSDGRLVRIVQDNLQQYVPLVRDPSVTRYDVVVDEAPASPNVKERTWLIIEKFLPFLTSAGLPLPPEMVEYLPLPSGLVEAIKKMMQPDPNKAQMQKVLEMLDFQSKQALLQQQLAVVAKDQASAQKAATEAAQAASPVETMLKTFEAAKLQGEATITNVQAQREQMIGPDVMPYDQLLDVLTKYPQFQQWLMEQRQKIEASIPKPQPMQMPQPSQQAQPQGQPMQPMPGMQRPQPRGPSSGGLLQQQGTQMPRAPSAPAAPGMTPNMGRMGV